MLELEEKPEIEQSSEAHGDDRRTSFRCSVHKSEEAAILRTRKTDLMVRVAEKSAGGFGVFAQSNPPIKVGQILSLAMTSGCSEVEVVHVTELDGESRIGLKHVCDLAFLPSNGRLAGLARRGIFSLAGRGLRTALIIALCGAFFTFGVFLPGNWWRDMLGRSKKSSSSLSPFANLPATQREQLLAKSFVNLDGIKARGFFDALKLSTEQQVKVHAIVEDTTSALSELYQQKDVGPPDVWSDLGLQLIHRSYEKIQRELTDEQRARWNELSK